MIEFDDVLHDRAELLTGHVSAALIQATAWWIAAELIRRHPQDLTVIETHPGGGTYDCLSVYRREPDTPTAVVLMNQGGSITHGSWFGEGDHDRFQWSEVILTPARRSYVVEQLERIEELSPPASTPATVTTSIGPRVIAAFVARTALGRGGHPEAISRMDLPWYAANGFFDTSGYGPAGRRDELFAALPAADDHSRRADTRDLYSEPAFRYWFVVDRHQAPVVAVDITHGMAWSQHDEFDLMAMYESNGRRLDPIVNKVFPYVG